MIVNEIWHPNKSYDLLNKKYFTGDKRRNKFHGKSIKKSSSERRILSLTTSHDMILCAIKEKSFCCLFFCFSSKKLQFRCCLRIFFATLFKDQWERKFSLENSWQAFKSFSPKFSKPHVHKFVFIMKYQDTNDFLCSPAFTVNWSLSNDHLI